MHQYSTDVGRRVSLAMMGILAAVTANTVNPLLQEIIKPQLVQLLPELFTAALRQNAFVVTAMFALTVIFTFYNGFFWRFLSEYTPFEPTPVFQGTWLLVRANQTPDTVLTQARQSDNTDTPYDWPQLVIGQTWTDIEIGFLDPGSRYWRSDSAMIWSEDAPNPGLVCTYQQEPLGVDSDWTQSDRGTIRLRFLSEDVDRLVGQAYTESGVTEHRLEFVRVDKPLIPRLIEDVPTKFIEGIERGRRRG